MKRRNFIKATMIAGAAAAIDPANLMAQQNQLWETVDDFDRPNSLYHGDGWESLNPGYWRVENQALRRRLKNVGDRNPTDAFPWHWETHQGKPMPIEYDPSLPFGMIWRRDWKLKGNYKIRVEFTVRQMPTEPEGGPRWRQEKAGYAMMGICFGGSSLYESRGGANSSNWKGSRSRGEAFEQTRRRARSRSGDASWMAAWRDSGTFGIYDHATDEPLTAQEGSEQKPPSLKAGDSATIELAVTGQHTETATVTATLQAGASSTTVTCRNVDRRKFTEGHFGLLARGLLDFEVKRVALHPGGNQPVDAPVNDLHVCYPLGDTLQKVDRTWRCKFVALFRSDGRQAEVRVSDSPNPTRGWQNIPAAGKAKIVDNDFRRFTAVIDVNLPFSPADKTMYYTLWKDGKDVTTDPRRGWLGKKEYVGRLPRLKAPYRLAGLGGHAIHGGGPNLPNAGRFQENWIHDQPTPDAYKYIEDHNLQILVWDDDVWYLELLFSPPSTDDAYKIITLTIAGPTARWQMMRHWNVINPGDHDYGMDDVKGPEQYLVRQHDDLGQDREYVRRNFKIVQHLVRAKENPSGTDNPKHWRRWKMPNADFSLVILDSRLWRTSQDTKIWDDEGWGHKTNLYDRTDPTRTLLGEEQFAWLQEIIRTDSSSLICLTGVNALHTIWTGVKEDPQTGLRWNQRDRVAADYAGWVKAGADRVIELLGSRSGVVTVYGDVHLASIMQNLDHRFYECSFGPIGRTGSRRLKEGFGPEMTDYDGRPLRIHALYHDRYDSPNLRPRKGPKIWNFLEMQFDPRGEDPFFLLRIRNVIDPPSEDPRGGGTVQERASNTGRPISCSLPPIKTLPNAGVHLSTINGRPIRGVRSLDNGVVPLRGLIDVAPGTPILITSFDGTKTDTQLIKTLPLGQ
ncbi:alkaline phosphatase D family protein [Acidobacteria bacterium AH-259-O06]|nr:alkaline phosphatase D family protein [Acidobacteria bacterium AH-259-O06]